MMENLQRKRSENRLSLLKVGVWGIFCALVCFSMLGHANAAVEQEPKEPTPEETAALEDPKSLDDLLKTYFTYQRENRSDPFATFIKKDIQTVRVTGEEPVEEEILTGMQLFEPGQLTLVSIVFSEARALAMVQDSVGMGYIIEEGTMIGRRGVVEQILPNVVVIKQWSMTFAGKKKYKNIEMVLRKEGE